MTVDTKQRDLKQPDPQRAVLQRDIRQEQHELNRLMRVVTERFARRESDLWAGAVRLLDALDELREHLGMMFALKETGGYLEALAPSRCGCADRLRADHGWLFEVLSRMIEQCDDDLRQQRWPEGRALAAMTSENFRQQLREHQRGEADLARQTVTGVV